MTPGAESRDDPRSGSGDEPPFEVRRGSGASCLVFASPHSGRIYPAALMDASTLDARAIRRSEDAFVDELIEGGTAIGAATLLCRTARVWVDVNRDPWELDPAMFDGPLPAHARSQTPRVAAGLGSIARLVGEGQEIYGRKLSLGEAESRIERAHRPYHEALAALIEEARTACGVAVLIDWHSMPSAASRAEVRRGRAKPDFVLGDRHGASCGRELTALVRRTLERSGYVVGLNNPYAGGWTTQTYGRPQEGVHALQVEIDRSLYLDEARLERSAGFGRLKRDLERLFGVLAGTDWKDLLGR